MVIPPRGAPVFLLETRTYKDYINPGVRGDLIYPPYEWNDWGVIIMPGEAFCRFPNCMDFRYPYSSTAVLRTHIRRHRIHASGGLSRGMSRAEKKDVIRWYRRLVDGSDTEEEERAPTDSSVSSDSDEEDEDKEDDDKEDDDKEDDDEEGGIEIEVEAYDQ